MFAPRSTERARSGQSARVTDSERRLDELEHRVARLSQEVAACVHELLIDDEVLPRFVVAERLHELGSAFDSALEALRRDVRADNDVIALAALLSFANGNREWSVQVLFDEVEHRGQWATLAAMRLAQARIAGVCTAVLTALRDTDAHEFDAIVGFLNALHTMGCSLPSFDRAQLLGNPHWQVTAAIAEWFPT